MLRPTPLDTQSSTPDNAAVASDPDADVVRRAAVNPDAFATLYGRYAGTVCRYCYHRLGSWEDAEDATSIVFARVAAALSRYRDGSFRAWLFTIAHNVAGDIARSRRQDVPLDAASEVVDVRPTPEELFVAAEERLTRRRVLAHLTTEQRHVLELRLAGLTGPEIAHVLGRSHASVKMLQLRAATRIRRLLGDDATSRETNDDA